MIQTFLFIGLFFLQEGFGQIPDTSVFKTLTSKDTIKASKEWTPKNLDECFKRLDEILPDSVKTEMKNGTERGMVMYHHGFGTYLRNSWGLWKGGALKKYFNDLGIFHPDDMSGIILTSYWRRLKSRPIQLEKQIQYYKDYWKKQKMNEGQ